MIVIDQTIQTKINSFAKRLRHQHPNTSVPLSFLIELGQSTYVDAIDYFRKNEMPGREAVYGWWKVRYAMNKFMNDHQPDRFMKNILNLIKEIPPSTSIDLDLDHDEFHLFTSLKTHLGSITDYPTVLVYGENPLINDAYLRLWIKESSTVHDYQIMIIEETAWSFIQINDFIVNQHGKWIVLINSFKLNLKLHEYDKLLKLATKDSNIIIILNGDYRLRNYLYRMNRKKIGYIHISSLNNYGLYNAEISLNSHSLAHFIFWDQYHPQSSLLILDRHCVISQKELQNEIQCHLEKGCITEAMSLFTVGFHQAQIRQLPSLISPSLITIVTYFLLPSLYSHLDSFQFLKWQQLFVDYLINPTVKEGMDETIYRHPHVRYLQNYWHQRTEDNSFANYLLTPFKKIPWSDKKEKILEALVDDLCFESNQEIFKEDYSLSKYDIIFDKETPIPMDVYLEKILPSISHYLDEIYHLIIPATTIKDLYLNTSVRYSSGLLKALNLKEWKNYEELYSLLTKDDLYDFLLLHQIENSLALKIAMSNNMSEEIIQNKDELLEKNVSPKIIATLSQVTRIVSKQSLESSLNLIVKLIYFMKTLPAFAMYTESFYKKYTGVPNKK